MKELYRINPDYKNIFPFSEWKESSEWFKIFREYQAGRFFNSMTWKSFSFKYLISNVETEIDFLLGKDFKLLKLGFGSKLPMFGSRWSKKEWGKDYYEEPTRDELIAHLRHFKIGRGTGNLAVLANRSNIIGVDMDQKQIRDRENFFLQFYEKTLVSKTPAGGLHLYFHNDLLKEELGLDPEEAIVRTVLKSEADIVRTNNEYLVCPPSELTEEVCRTWNYLHQDEGKPWTPGIYQWIDRSIPILPFSRVVKLARKTLK